MAEEAVMAKPGAREWFYFTIAVLAAIILFWFGDKFLFFPSEELNSPLVLGTGLLLVLFAVMSLGPKVLQLPRRWMLILAIFGLYFIARAAGVLEIPLLARGAGVAAWLAALLVLYITWPYRNHHAKEQDEHRL
jgi:hypothetical protein